jgi:hypothetical protein
MTLTNQNSMHAEIKRRLAVGNFAFTPFRIVCLSTCYKRTRDRLKYENITLKRMGKTIPLTQFKYIHTCTPPNTRSVQYCHSNL